MLTRLDDALIDHDKVERAGEILGKHGYERALGAACWGLVHANRKLTDGFLAQRALDKYGINDATAAALVEARLWEARDGGYQIHDFHDWNPTAQEVKAKQAHDRLRKRKAYGFHEDSVRNPRGTPADGGGDAEWNPLGIHKDSARFSLRARPQAPAVTGRERVDLLDGEPEREPVAGPTLARGQALAAVPGLIEAWNRHVSEPFVRVPAETLSPRARTEVAQALQQHPDLDWWGRMVVKLVADPYARGDNDRGWVADFWWLLKNAHRVEARATPQPGRQTHRPAADPPTPRQPNSREVGVRVDEPDVGLSPEQIADLDARSKRLAEARR
jgi:hypothetical protein